MKNKEKTPVFVAGVNDELWREKRVLQVFEVSRSHWHDLVHRGIAPKGIKVSPRITVWRASEIQAFIEKLATVGVAGIEKGVV